MKIVFCSDIAQQVKGVTNDPTKCRRHRRLIRGLQNPRIVLRVYLLLLGCVFPPSL